MSADRSAKAPDEAPIVVELVSCPATLPRPSGSNLGEMTWRADAWTPDEVRHLRQLFADDMPIADMAEALGRGREAIADRLRLLGLRRHTSRPWTEWEDSELTRRYGHEATATIASDLGRSCGATYVRAALLDLTERNPPEWTEWEDAQLRAGFASGIPTVQIAAIIGRPHLGLTSRASKLGLRHPNHSPEWSAAEIDRALELSQAGCSYTAIGARLAAEGFAPRTKAGLQAMMRKTGLGKGWGRFWSPEEDALLKRAYERGDSLTPLQHRLSRSRFSIRWRAEYLKLRGTHVHRNGWRTAPDWTASDEEWLRRDYGTVPTPELARQMGRTTAAIFNRANVLGLAHGYHRPWTDEEQRALQIAHDRGIAIADLALALGRKLPAVHKYAAKRGLLFGRRARSNPAPSLQDILELAEAP